MSTHVVLGTGQVGRFVVEHLVALGRSVVAVNRSGSGTFPGADVVAADVTDPEVARRLLTDAATVYFCLNATHYDRWPTEFPPLQRAVVNAVATSGSRLVVLENLYSYGPTGGRPMTEETPVNPTSDKSATRAAMTTELLDAHARGEIRVAIGRAADLVGPGVRASSLGEQVFTAAITAGRALTMGRPDTLHSYSYAPDVGRSLVDLGDHPEAYGRVWHLPTPPTITTREAIERIFGAAGTRPKVTAVRKPILATIGLFNRDSRDLLATYYQFAEPFVVDDSAYRRTIGGTTTGWDEIVETTLSWYRDRMPAHNAP